MLYTKKTPLAELILERAKGLVPYCIGELTPEGMLLSALEVYNEKLLPPDEEWDRFCSIILQEIAEPLLAACQLRESIKENTKNIMSDTIVDRIVSNALNLHTEADSLTIELSGDALMEQLLFFIYGKRPCDRKK